MKHRFQKPPKKSTKRPLLVGDTLLVKIKDTTVILRLARAKILRKLIFSSADGVLKHRIVDSDSPLEFSVVIKLIDD